MLESFVLDKMYSTGQSQQHPCAVRGEIACVLKDTLPHHYLFLYLSLCPVADQCESNRFAYLFLPHFCLNSGMS